MHRKIHTSIGEWYKKKRRKPLLLQGARQVGKTHALKKFGEAHSGKYHYFERLEGLFPEVIYLYSGYYFVNRRVTYGNSVFMRRSTSYIASSAH